MKTKNLRHSGFRQISQIRSKARVETRIEHAAFLPYVQVMEFGDTAAVHYAEIRADLKRRGTFIGANDLFIAAHARALEITLVTNNTDEFARVSHLKVENWTLAARRRARQPSKR